MLIYNQQTPLPRLVPPCLACARYALKRSGQVHALALLSRRQYLSRMDRFQHGRSARTVGPEGPEIN
jgi:hypothetical protein